MSKKVLIVDDAAFLRMQLKEMFVKCGAEVVGEAANGAECLEKYPLLKPDLVTMDITMPTTDGIQALQLIKHYDKDACVVMITAAGQKDKMLQALKEGAAEFITKPFDKEEVVKIIGKIV